MSLSSLIAARRTDGMKAAAQLPRRSVLITGDSFPHGRTVQREVSSTYVTSRGVRVTGFTPAWVQRAQAGTLPFHRDLPIE